jgi:hypothetical protein
MADSIGLGGEAGWVPQVSRLRPGILLVKAHSVPFCYFRLDLVSRVYNFCYITGDVYPLAVLGARLCRLN